ncbi:MAG: M28 family peptidase [Vicinamibacterales bacterium]
MTVSGRLVISATLALGAVVGGAIATKLPSATMAAAQRQPAAGAAAARTAQPPQFDSARAWAHLRQLIAIGPRPAGSAQLRQTRAYITRQLAALGLTVQEQAFTADTPMGRVEMVNLAVRLPGRRSDRILITGHYDTKLFRTQTFVGASDGGSSAAFLLELARTLRDRPREFTHEIVWLDGEEAFCSSWTECGRPGSPDNTYGSRYYVQAARKAGALASIKAMVLVDMIGDTDLQIRRDSNSARWLTDIIWNTARRLAYGGVFVNADTTVEDDHLPFVEAGVPSVDIIDLDYPYWHTPDDTLQHVSARSLQAVGDVLVAALPDIESHFKN